MSATAPPGELPLTDPPAELLLLDTVVTRDRWLQTQLARLQHLLAANPDELLVAPLADALQLLSTGYDIVFGSGWAAPLANACKADLRGHVEALRSRLAAAPEAERARLSVEQLVTQELAAHGGAEALRRELPRTVVNNLLWIQRILAFIARFLSLIIAGGMGDDRKPVETYTAARAAYAEFFAPFHIKILQWAVPPLLGLVPRKASMLATMAPLQEPEADAAGLALVRLGLLPASERLRNVLGANGVLFDDKAGHAF